LEYLEANNRRIYDGSFQTRCVSGLYILVAVIVIGLIGWAMIEFIGAIPV
jgi:hypothetical protein